MVDLVEEISALPAGAYAIACSGGADSTALVRLLASRRDCRCVIVHLNHELRGQESDADAAFVETLAGQLNLPAVVARRSSIEPTLPNLPANPSARYRAMRLALFSRTIRTLQLDGVVLAHHADDQAETVFLRLIRGSGALGLRGIRPTQQIADIVLHHPLLRAPRGQLRRWLLEIGQPWREDRSNESPDYRRNVVRQLLAHRPDLVPLLLQLADDARALVTCLDDAAPALPETISSTSIENLPRILADHLLRAWLVARGADEGPINRQTTRRLAEQILDAASPSRQNYPGKLLVQRRRGQVSILSP